MLGVVEGVDAVVGPVASDLPPALGTSARRPLGDPSFISIWTAFGFPMLSLPTGVSDTSLPFGLQLVAGPRAERRLIRAAAWCEAAIGPLRAPP